MLANGYKWEQKMAAVEDILECPSGQQHHLLHIVTAPDLGS
jgi:hypothetical protein